MSGRTLSELAEITGATLVGPGEVVIEGTAGLAEASPREISFCSRADYARGLETTSAGAVVVPAELAARRADLRLLVHADPNAAFTQICGVFAAARVHPEPGLHPLADVDPQAQLGPGVSVGAFCSVAAGARVGAGCVLHAGVRVGPKVVIGARSEIHPNAVLYEGVTLGERCIVHAGAVLGGDGFGYEPPADPGGPWRKIPHSGRVEIEDDVEIGAGATVDRARFGATRIGRGAKLDNLVHVAHNCVIGAGSMIAAQVGLAGSVRVGRGVLLGGQVGIGGHLEVGDGARLGGQAGVIGNVPAGVELWGTPARPRREYFRQMAELSRVGALRARVAELERRLAARSGRAAEHAAEHEQEHTE